VKSNIAKTEVSCCVCGSAESSIIARGREHEYRSTTDDLFTVVKCSKCDLVYLNPRPADTEISTIYPEEYAAYVDDEAPRTGSLLARLKEQFVDKLGYPSRVRFALKYFAPHGETLKMLDVGCGTGRVLSLFRQYHSGKTETVGLDSDEHATKLAAGKGHQVIHGMFETASIPRASFDFVYSSHVIEHVADPGAFLRKVQAILKPGGLFFCETPNIGSIDARLLSRLGIWGGFHFPRHWTFFTPESLRQLGESAGLKVLEVRYYLVPIFWLWSLHALAGRLFGLRVADKLFPPIERDANPFQLLLLTGGFSLVDAMIFAVTRRTACMFLVFTTDLSRKEAPVVRKSDYRY
jgi:SAM-dependent methyltransferase